MLYQDSQLPDLYEMKHRHDNDVDFVDYESNILNKTLSPYIFNNSIMGNFLGKLQKMLSLLFDEHNIIKNWKNYMVDKYYFKHKN